MAGIVLILASADHAEARRVASTLERRGHATAWLDLADFPQRVSVSASLGAAGWEGYIRTPHSHVELSEIGAVYYRQSSPFELPDGLSHPERQFAMVEARFGLGGILGSLPVRWVSHPAAVADAEYKPVQLAVAARVGLTVPATWMGNDPGAGRSFVEKQEGGAVYKTIMHKIFSEEGGVKAIYTSPVDAEHIDDQVATTMHQFQARVRDARDMRVLVTHSGCEAVGITYRDARPRLDYRAHYDVLDYHRIQLSQSDLGRCRRLLSALGLNVGVVDMAVTADGATLFYEINPCGAWAWLEDVTGAPMAEMVADALVEERE